MVVLTAVTWRTGCVYEVKIAMNSLTTVRTLVETTLIPWDKKFFNVIKLDDWIQLTRELTMFVADPSGCASARTLESPLRGTDLPGFFLHQKPGLTQFV